MEIGMKRELTCIVCPVGCTLSVEIGGSKVISVSGNTCKRGVAYAEDECIAPKRTVTTTVRCQNGALLPVKTATPIPKEKVHDAMKIINKANPHLPILIGDVIIEDVYGSKVVATKNIF